MTAMGLSSYENEITPKVTKEIYTERRHALSSVLYTTEMVLISIQYINQLSFQNQYRFTVLAELILHYH